MLTLLDINRAIDRLGEAAFVPRTLRAPSGSRYDGDTVIELVTERILPSQFGDLRRNTDAIAPEGRLMLAVLEDAVHIYQRCCRLQDARSRRLFRETDEWFTSNEATSPFSFLIICQVFGFDPDYLRGVSHAGGARTGGMPEERARSRSPSGASRARVIGSRCSGVPDREGDDHVGPALRSAHRR
jgi:hypothetical protein